jgi:Ser-tRNA(Ala) deacylase AlaX
MKTKPLYLEDSYLKDMDGVILEISSEGEQRWRIMLDQTVFYPMGGGQPTDQGILMSPGWVGKVYQVLNKEGEIWHYIEGENPPEVGTKVHGQLDWDRRFFNMRLHSGGHVVDFAMHLLGYSPTPLYPTKGDHGKKPSIIYTGVLGKDITRELEAKSNDLIKQGLAFTTAFVPLSELEKDAIYLQPGLPTNKPLRKLTLEGVGSVADGGTQVKRTSEVGSISIPSVTEGNGTTLVAYRLG